MTDEALSLAFALACSSRDRAERRIKDLERVVMNLRVTIQQLETRLRIADLMDQEGARRLLAAVEDDSHSLRVVQ